ncbi:MAG: efflux RND transporter periplasmic adaptor subunit [Chlamydiales bacterium]
MRRKHILIALCIFIIIAIGVALLVYFYTLRKNSDVLTLYGNVDVREVDIGFRVAGQVESMFFEEGDLVKKGDFLAKLDPTPYMSQQAQAKENEEVGLVNYQNAQKLLDRRQELIGIGGVSKEDLENAQASRDALYASWKALQAAHSVATDNLHYTEAFAPTEGVVLTRIREPGTVVNPADPIYTLSITSPVWIRAYVDEPNLGNICYGMEATVYTDTSEIGPFKGQIGFISPIAEFTPKTVETTKLRTDLVYRLRIYVDNPDCNLKQGMPVTVKIPLKQAEQQERDPSYIDD